MASSKCSVNSCKRDFDTLCGHCQSNVCSKHYVEHLKLSNEEIIPLADRLNSLINDVQQGVPLQCALQQLEQWRTNAHQQVDKICDEKKQHIEEIIKAKLVEQMEKLREIRQEVKELIDEGDASFKQIQKLKTAIDNCQKQYQDFKAPDFVKMDLKPIEIMIHIMTEKRFHGGTLLTEEHQTKLNEFYGNTYQKWVLIYKATRDGFQAANFHRCCDNQGPTMTVIQSKSGGYLFGGCTSVAWRSVGNYVADDNGTFIFTLTNPHGIATTKYNIATKQYAIYDASSHGPTFGAGFDVHVCNNSQSAGGSYTKFPHSYTDTTGRGSATFTGNINFQTSEIEVYRLQPN